MHHGCPNVCHNSCKACPSRFFEERQFLSASLTSSIESHAQGYMVDTQYTEGTKATRHASYYVPFLVNDIGRLKIVKTPVRCV